MSLGAQLGQLRLKKKKSLQDVAEAVGVSKTHIWELEKGRTLNPSLDMVKKLSDYFGVPVSSLIGENPEDGNPKLQLMFRQVGDLCDNDRIILNDMIQLMHKRRRNSDGSD